MRTTVFLALLLSVFPLVAQRSSLGPVNRPQGNRSGPWDNDVLVYKVDTAGQSERLANFERAGVPTLARMFDGRLIAAHQHFPENNPDGFDKVAVRFSSDEGRTWTEPKVIRVVGLPEGMRFPFDPTLVPLPDGRLRLYFTGNFGRTFDRSTPNIRSAISTNGVDYTFEPGTRFEVSEKLVIDCAVVLHRDVFHLFVPDNGAPPSSRPSPGRFWRESWKRRRGFPRDQPGRSEFYPRGRCPHRGWTSLAGRRPIGWKGDHVLRHGRPPEAENGFGSGTERGGIWTGTSTNGSEWKLSKFLEVGGADPGARGGTRRRLDPRCHRGRPAAKLREDVNEANRACRHLLVPSTAIHDSHDSSSSQRGRQDFERCWDFFCSEDPCCSGFSALDWSWMERFRRRATGSLGHVGMIIAGIIGCFISITDGPPWDLVLPEIASNCGTETSRRRRVGRSGRSNATVERAP